MRIQLPFALLVAIFACSMHATPAQAQRVFVSATGSDGNPCTFALPCRSFQHAHDIVAFAGEIDVLDPAGYGALTISKSISIQGHAFAGLAVASGNGITINTSAVVANLRGLLIDGVGTGGNGIVLTAGSTLNIQDSLIRNFGLAGINVGPAAGTSRLYVANTHVTDNVYGISVVPSGTGTAQGSLDHVTVENSSTVNAAIGFGPGAIFSMSNCVVAGNNGIGINVDATVTSVVTVENCKITNNAIGLEASNAGAIVRLNRSTITGNTGHSFFISGGAFVYSYLDNYIDGNGTDGGTLTTVAKR
jgi:hypothetical protein